MTAEATERVLDAVREMKPRLRGWLHLGTFPLSVAGGLLLVALAPTTQLRVATGIFAASAALLFGISALYHRRYWSPRADALLRRLDHSNIFLLIAGTYTPFAISLLGSRDAEVLLGLVWGGALIGIAFRVLWIGASRWLYIPVYVALGWAAVFWLGDFSSAAGPAVLALVVAGGVLYSLGGLVYGLQRPNPAPAWFGFHEVFHSFTIAAFVAHYIGIFMVVHAAR